jgi:hypothetical protein
LLTIVQPSSDEVRVEGLALVSSNYTPLMIAPVTMICGSAMSDPPRPIQRHRRQPVQAVLSFIILSVWDYVHTFTHIIHNMLTRPQAITYAPSGTVEDSSSSVFGSNTLRSLRFIFRRRHLY